MDSLTRLSPRVFSRRGERDERYPLRRVQAPEGSEGKRRLRKRRAEDDENAEAPARRKGEEAAPSPRRSPRSTRRGSKEEEKPNLRRNPRRGAHDKEAIRRAQEETRARTPRRRGVEEDDDAPRRRNPRRGEQREEEEEQEEDEEEEEEEEEDDEDEEEVEEEEVIVPRRRYPRRRGRREEESWDDKPRYPKRSRRARSNEGAANAETADAYLAMAKEDDEFFDYYYAKSPRKRATKESDEESESEAAALFGGSRRSKSEARQEDPPRRAEVSAAASPFDGIAGLAAQRAALEEMVLLPLRHPGLFESLGVGPPRGVLFHGPPGTGKTALAREVARACARESTKVSFFARKGGDLLNKYVGEAERALTTLFEEARRGAPSIIFFDEIDGLAPCRNRTVDNDQANQDSVVATLLALMDGLDDRGDVVVIGSTNRPDAVDPALRRPGRFDRELEFSPPDLDDRAAIVKLHSRHWKRRPSDGLVLDVARRADGLCGADLKQLCAEAAIAALRRHRPDLFRERAEAEALPLAGDVVVHAQDFDLALGALKAAASSRRAKSINHGALAPAPLAAHHRALYGRVVAAAAAAATRVAAPAIPRERAATAAARAAVRARSAAYRRRPEARLDVVAISSERDRDRELSLVAAAVLHELDAQPGRGEHVDVGLGALLREARTHPSLEAALAARAREARAKTGPATLFLPDARDWWAAAPDALRLATRAILREAAPVVLVTTGKVDDDDGGGDDEWARFLETEGARVSRVPIEIPKLEDRAAFFECVLGDVGDAVRAAVEAAADAADAADQPRVAPPPPPPAPKPARKEDPEERARDEHCLRELRVFFRAALRELRNDRAMAALWRPIDPDECPEFYQVADDPLDLSVVRARVDARRYATLRAFLDDLASIRRNARTLATVMPGDARADDNAHAAAHAEDLVRSMAHRFERKLGWDLVARCDRMQDRQLACHPRREEEPREPEEDLARAAVRDARAADARADRSRRRNCEVDDALPSILDLSAFLAKASLRFPDPRHLDRMADAVWRSAEDVLATDDPLPELPNLQRALRRVADLVEEDEEATRDNDP
ncbi:hypothetical protein CTAYLR_002883 [Chrysophaeum taylorii]|uniref:Bromo domain-containing protein n=1 Tax=Chrysophaeum taylorii TaxID=2483200 RepID=A0AAD7XPN4_9STRA|nr:hypothetical protein CTAYLR_002883 [Chrysophaeum taylorii]